MAGGEKPEAFLLIVGANPVRESLGAVTSRASNRASHGLKGLANRVRSHNRVIGFVVLR
jgi:hypothetical protein